MKSSNTNENHNIKQDISSKLRIYQTRDRRSIKNLEISKLSISIIQTNPRTIKTIKDLILLTK